MKCKIISVKKENIQSALNEATLDIKDPKLIFICAELSKFKQGIKILSDKCPNAVVMGATGPSIPSGQILDDNIALFVIEDGIEVSAGVIQDISKYPVKHIAQIENTVNKLNTSNNNTVCLEMCTGNEEMLVSTFSSLLSKKGIPLVGGTTQGNDDNGTKYVGFNGVVYEDACVYAVIKNLNGKIRVYNESIYSDKHEKLVATKVNTSTREILEINGHNAADVYCNKLGITKSEIAACNMTNPLGRKIGNDIFITAINPDNSKTALQCYKKVNQNDLLTILKLDDYKKIIENTVDKIKSDFNSISAIFSVNCIVRYLLFKKLNYIDEYSKLMNFAGNHFGIIGDGEQFINQHVNQTMVCIVFE